jgi:hypothetical protein
MELTKLKKIVDDVIAEKKKGTEDNLILVSGEIKRMVDSKISITKQIQVLRKGGIKTNQRKLSQFIKLNLDKKGE